MGSKVKKQELVAEELKARGNICVLCKAKSDDVEIHWHHVIMLFEKPRIPKLDKQGEIKFDRKAAISALVCDDSRSVNDVREELKKCIPLCATCHLDRIHGHAAAA